jgi:hypothetical protein
MYQKEVIISLANGLYSGMVSQFIKNGFVRNMWSMSTSSENRHYIKSLR